jgi:hypothetical protein
VGKSDARIVNDPTLSKFKMERLVPYDPNDADLKLLLVFNHFISPWVVSIADPCHLLQRIAGRLQRRSSASSRRD